MLCKYLDERHKNGGYIAPIPFGTWLQEAIKDKRPGDSIGLDKLPRIHKNELFYVLEIKPKHPHGFDAKILTLHGTIGYIVLSEAIKKDKRPYFEMVCIAP